MSGLRETLDAVTSALQSLETPFALVGGLAVSVRTEPRFTRDVDLAVSVPDDSAAEAVVRALLGQGWRIQAQVEQEAVGRLSILRLLPPEGTPNVHVVDLLFASSGLEPELVEAAEPLEVLPGITVPVATSEHLLALKVLAMDDHDRAQDRLDALALLASLPPGALTTTRQALELITQRGYNRGKDLPQELESLLPSP